MLVYFDLDFDGDPWPGPHGASAVVGETWVGVGGFLGLLETHLGLTGLFDPDSARIAGLVPAVRSIEGFWSKSAHIDPFGVSATLLNWRDELWSGGWRGQGLTPRLGELARVTAQVKPGLPDRLSAVVKRLERQAVDIRQLKLLVPPPELPVPWRNIVERLVAHGTRVELVSLPQAHDGWDLQRAQRPGFAPAGDGSLQLLRPLGPVTAAEEVAAWLATGPWKETLIIGSDPLLDAALERFGLPTTGACGSLATNALLEILPLILALGWSPADPQRALELLTLPRSPIRPGIGRRLLKALKTWPAVGSDVWAKALEEGLQAIADPEERVEVQQRMDLLLKPGFAGNAYPTSELLRRSQSLQTWLRGAMAHEEAGPEAWNAALVQCLNFQRLVELCGQAEFSASQIQRLLEQATAEAPSAMVRPAQAGLRRVTRPGAVAGAAARIVWWNFDRENAPKPSAIPLTSAERLALTQAGVELPDLARAAMGANARWRRPLLCAQENLLLVCPRNGANRDELHPHPLWDEIAAYTSGPADLAKITGVKPIFSQTPALARPEILPPPTPRENWQLPAGYELKRRDKESPSGAEKLLGCPFLWTLQYLGKVWDGESAALPENERLWGSLAHEILSRLFKRGLMPEFDARDLALELFEREGPRLAAPLFMPGQEVPRSKQRELIGRSAYQIYKHLNEARMSILATEETRQAPALGTVMEGQVDLVAGPQPVIVDFKYGREEGRQTELKNGTACQLAAYSFLWRRAEHHPPTAYFILKNQRLFTTTPGLFPRATVIDGPEPQKTWAAFEASYQQRWAELSNRQVKACGQLDEKNKLSPAESQLDGRTLRLTPPCNQCRLGLLCSYGIKENA